MQDIAALLVAGRCQEALRLSEIAIGQGPTVQLHLLRAAALLELNRPADAVRAVEDAGALGPIPAPGHVMRGHALTRMGDTNGAIAAFERALSLNPADVQTHQNLGLLLLSLGRFEEAGPHYQTRLKRLRPIRMDVPRWAGQPIAGKRLLVAGEQGLGDTVQFIRYLPMLAAAGAELTVVVQPNLVDVVREVAPAATWIGYGGAAGGDYHYQVDLLSLPFLLGTRLETIPADVPYLSARADLIAAWQAALGERGFKIGIAWHCHAGARDEKLRSLPLTVFAPLAEIPGVRLISIQGASGLDELDGLPFAVERLGAAVEGNPDGITQIAAIMAGVDLVITVDSLPAHLAGALGRPVWVCLKDRPDWRWLRDRSELALVSHRPALPPVDAGRLACCDLSGGRCAPADARSLAGIRSTGAARISGRGRTGGLRGRISLSTGRTPGRCRGRGTPPRRNRTPSRAS